MVGVFPALFAPYRIAQLLGGTLAALIASNVFGFTGTAASLAVAPALLAEILGRGLRGDAKIFNESRIFWNKYCIFSSLQGYFALQPAT